MVEEMIARVFAARDAAHLEHWRTKNGEEHRALGDFYDGVIDKVDKYVEAHQGAFGLVGDVKLEQTKSTGKISEFLRDEMVWLTENRSQIARSIPALENLLDDLTGLYLTTLYKLENLR